LNKRTSSYLTFLGLKECQHRLIPEKGGGIPFLLFYIQREELFDILPHIYITCKIIKNTYFEIRNVIPYDDHQRMEHRLIPEKGGGIPFLLFCDNDQYIDNVFSFLLKNITGKTLCYNIVIYQSLFSMVFILYTLFTKF
jgi:hypothetical protein